MGKTVSFVLHGHMPWVLHHGHWPHGNVWLFEAALGVYIPLLQMLENIEKDQISAQLSLGLTPVLLMQLSHEDFKSGFETFLNARISEVENCREKYGHLAEFWLERFTKIRAFYLEIERDIPKAFIQYVKEDGTGRISLLASTASHGFSPLLSSTQSFEQQLEEGLNVYEQLVGFRPKGLWLPECAFLPETTRPSPIDGSSPWRKGIDRILAENGISHFFIEASALEANRSEGKIVDSHFQKVTWEEANQHPDEWRDVCKPYRVSTIGQWADIHCFARHPKLCSQVWAADGGYPGDGQYLEFHKKEGEIRFWRVTSRQVGLGQKEFYNPEEAKKMIHYHAKHYVDGMEDALKDKPDGHLSLCFDAELFGHWWFEGPEFLEQVLREIAQREHLTAISAETCVEDKPAENVVWIPESTWGEGGDHRVWLNGQTHWMWKVIYGCEQRFFEIVNHQEIKGKWRWELFQALKWELLMLQASDWLFVIKTGGAVDYGHRRFCLHVERFERLMDIWNNCAHKKDMSERQKIVYKEVSVHQGWWDVLDA